MTRVNPALSRSLYAGVASSPFINDSNTGTDSKTGTGPNPLTSSEAIVHYPNPRIKCHSLHTGINRIK